MSMSPPGIKGGVFEAEEKHVWRHRAGRGLASRPRWAENSGETRGEWAPAPLPGQEKGMSVWEWVLEGGCGWAGLFSQSQDLIDLGVWEHSDWPSGGRGWLAEERGVDSRKLKCVSTTIVLWGLLQSQDSRTTVPLSENSTCNSEPKWPQGASCRLCSNFKFSSQRIASPT